MMTGRGGDLDLGSCAWSSFVAFAFGDLGDCNNSWEVVKKGGCVGGLEVLQLSVEFSNQEPTPLEVSTHEIYVRIVR